MSGAHRRLNPLTGRHVLVSAGRQSRPWQGQIELPEQAIVPAHDPDCFLCPGNVRANGERNPEYDGVHVFDNDFAALSPDPVGAVAAREPLFETVPSRGRSRVLCYAPAHDVSLATMTHGQVRAVIDAWSAEAETLSRDFAHVQLFENRGAMMGASSPHPHGQIWATDYLPDEIVVEDRLQAQYLARHGRPLLAEVVERELESGERLVAAAPRWLAIVPFWASWPFEILLLPRFDVARLPDLSAPDREALAAILTDLVGRYDALFGTPFPYSMGWHGAPRDADQAAWRLHAHFYPPLLRSATVRKFMVGFELLAETQRDLTPEDAAARLRAAR